MSKMSGVVDKQKLQNEQLQLIIDELLRDEDNRYCVDCDAKGPRWASWNIGVFLCIRCAAIHRNLGVHISKVKSVNLDSWTVGQLAKMHDMGNRMARSVYEALLPDTFRRPQTDTALETFIRAKYDQKRYLAKDYNPAPPNVDLLLELLHRLEQSTKKKPTSNPVNIGHVQGCARSRVMPSSKVIEKPPSSNPIDLLGLGSDSNRDEQQQPPQKNMQAVSAASADSNKNTQEHPQLQVGQGLIDPQAPSNPSSSDLSELFSLDLSNPAATTPQPICQPISVPTDPATDQPPKSTKESILALYAQSIHNARNSGSNSHAFPTGWAVPTGNQVFSSPSPFNQNMQVPMFPTNQLGGLTAPNMFQQTGTPIPTGLPVQHQNANAWNMVCNSSQQMPVSSGFVHPGYATAAPPASNEAYLSQVNSKLASLQSGRAVNN